MAYDLSFMQKIIVPRNKYHSVPQICKENCAKNTHRVSLEDDYFYKGNKHMSYITVKPFLR